MNEKSRKTTRSPWRTNEAAILREKYPTAMPVSEIAKLIPNHPVDSICAYAQKVMGLKRPDDGRFHENKGWDKISKLLKRGPLTTRDLAARIGVTRQSIDECLRRHRKEWHIQGEIARHGKYTRMIALGAGEDMHIRRNGKKRDRPEPEPINPFLVALGAVRPTQTESGRIIKQDMTVHSDEKEAA